MDWATGLSAGGQGHVFKVGRTDSVFTCGTVENASIVKRLISVLEHKVPSQVRQDGRTQRRAYFLDSNGRMDRLLSRTLRSGDGLNRRFRGMARRG